MFKECGNSDGRIFFEWNITNYCNYDCYYCSVANTMKSDPIKNHQTKAHRLVLAKLKNVKDKFVIDLAGGEPTLHDNFIDIVSALNDIERCKYISISTNFTAKMSFFEKLRDIALEKLDVGVSYHPQYHKIYMKNFDKIKFVTDNFKHTVNVLLPDNEQYWNDIREFTNRLRDNGIDFVLTILHGTENYEPNYNMDRLQEVFGDLFEYTKYDLQQNTFRYKFKDGTEEFLTHDQVLVRDLHKLKGITCDSYYYTIDMKGDVYRICTGERLGLRMDNLKVTVECPHDTCNCETRLYLNKRT